MIDDKVMELENNCNKILNQIHEEYPDKYWNIKHNYEWDKIEMISKDYDSKEIYDISQTRLIHEYNLLNNYYNDSNK